MITHLQKRNMKWWTGMGACASLFLIIVLYTIFQTMTIWRGVHIVADMQTANGSPIAHIVGNADKAVYLSLNGREIFIDKDGAFTEPVALIPGLSVVTLEAQDKFGKVSEKTFSVMYKESNQVALITH